MMSIKLYFYQHLNSELESVQVHEFCLKQVATYFPCISHPDIPPTLHNICRKSAGVELRGKYLLENQTDPWNLVHKVRRRSQIEKFNNKDFDFLITPQPTTTLSIKSLSQSEVRPVSYLFVFFSRVRCSLSPAQAGQAVTGTEQVWGLLPLTPGRPLRL